MGWFVALAIAFVAIRAFGCQSPRSIKTIDDLVAAAKSSENPKWLIWVDPEVTEANFSSTRPLRPNPTTTLLSELGLTGWNSCETVVATIDQLCFRSNMGEVLTYAVTPASQGGWDGETHVLIVLEDDRVACLWRFGSDRSLHLRLVGIDSCWNDDCRFLVFT